MWFQAKNIVVIRLGDSPDASLVPFNFQNDLWGKLNAIIKQVFAVKVCLSYNNDKVK